MSNVKLLKKEHQVERSLQDNIVFVRRHIAGLAGVIKQIEDRATVINQQLDALERRHRLEELTVEE